MSGKFLIVFLYSLLSIVIIVNTRIVWSFQFQFSAAVGHFLAVNRFPAGTPRLVLHGLFVSCLPNTLLHRLSLRLFLNVEWSLCEWSTETVLFSSHSTVLSSERNFSYTATYFSTCGNQLRAHTKLKSPSWKHYVQSHHRAKHKLI